MGLGRPLRFYRKERSGFGHGSVQHELSLACLDGLRDLLLVVLDERVGLFLRDFSFFNC